MNKKKFVILIALAVVLLLLLVNAGKFLVVEEAVQKADAIIVLSGDRGERVEKAAELYHQGYGKYFVISGGIIYNDVTAAELMKEHALKLGVPESAIILEDRADSTYENADFTRKVIKSYPIDSAIVVSSNYHMKRVKMIFERDFEHSGVKLYYAGAKDRYFNKTKWWSNNKSIMITVNEYIKMAGYALGKNY
ncbi:YdcF family protein [Paenibacillus sp. BSR1-1]|uniref:YdcF family protein n=1 Tax=Paenibacillus sp. BSR1-1 TaxID=3020845 RepID=UPI0025AF3AA6|nr:YdcF family protein [Paenibacillus sp. BSR1-1]MDN3019557.1 YdcF family protein [Paenibacillus sp. BSR1-1]